MPYRTVELYKANAALLQCINKKKLKIENKSVIVDRKLLQTPAQHCFM